MTMMVVCGLRIAVEQHVESLIYKNSLSPWAIRHSPPYTSINSALLCANYLSFTNVFCCKISPKKYDHMSVLMLTFHSRVIGHFFACFQAGCLSARWSADRLMIAQGWGGRRRGYYGSIQLATPSRLPPSGGNKTRKTIRPYCSRACHQHLSLKRHDTDSAVISPSSTSLQTSPPPFSSHFFSTRHRVKSDQLPKGLLKPSGAANAYSLYGNRNGKCALGIHKHFFLSSISDWCKNINLELQ